MLIKKPLAIAALILGVVAVGIGFSLDGEKLKTVSGVLIGIGAGLFGMSLSHLIMIRIERKNPQIARQNEIALHDERNTMIRNRAKAKSADVTQWFILGLAFIMILIDAPLWSTVSAIGVFVLYHILLLYFGSRYQKEL